MKKIEYFNAAHLICKSMYRLLVESNRAKAAKIGMLYKMIEEPL